jgi:hypothetical protein
MKLSTRYGMAAIAALAALTLVQWLRENRVLSGPLADYGLGVAPNLFAAIAITFVLISIRADQRKLTDNRSALVPFLISAAVAGAGLAGWELIQRTSDRFVFDGQDLAATLAGLGLSWLIFQLVTPRTAVGAKG